MVAINRLVVFSLVEVQNSSIGDFLRIFCDKCVVDDYWFI